MLHCNAIRQEGKKAFIRVSALFCQQQPDALPSHTVFVFAVPIFITLKRPIHCGLLIAHARPLGIAPPVFWWNSSIGKFPYSIPVDVLRVLWHSISLYWWENILHLFFMQLEKTGLYRNFP